MIAAPSTLHRTGAKDFSRFPELLDCHVERIVEAARIADSYLPHERLRRAGALLVENVLCRTDPSLPAAVAGEIAAVPPARAKNRSNLLAGTPRSEACRGAAERILAILDGLYAARRADVAVCFWRGAYRQHLVNRPHDGDEQKVFHCDTFFPALKFWYFPEAVDEGAPEYVPGSPALTPALLDWHRHQAAAIKTGRVEAWRGRGHREGSLRIAEQEIAALGLAPTRLACPADSLLIVNVFGFHRRGPVSAERRRLALHGSIRFADPFKAGTPAGRETTR